MRRPPVGRQEPFGQSPDEATACRHAAQELLLSTQHQGDAGYLSRLRDAVAVDDARLAFDFGAAESNKGWQAVRPGSVHTPETGFGWLPAGNETDATPEETYYAMANQYGAKYRGNEPVAGSLLFWPYPKPIPQPLRTNLGSGTSRTFRVNIPAGTYNGRVVTTNPAWTNRNFLISGMVAVNGAVHLLDAAHDRGAVVSRELVTAAPGGTLDFTFGGPTGWAVAALIIEDTKDTPEDPQVTCPSQ